MTYNQKIPPFKWFILENFPYIEEDFDALTNWQLFCKLGKEMNKIIQKCNLTGEQVEQLTNGFNALKEYVDNYFENLDIQTEVDNKLDEMAEDGTLAEIIAQYVELKSILAYNTIAEMKSATNLIEGSLCKTYGKTSFNDGLGQYYKVRQVTNQDVIDDIIVVGLTDELLVAELVPNMRELNVKYFGATGDGETDDINAIKKTIDYAEENDIFNIYFPQGTYIVSNQFKMFSNLNIYGDGTSSLIKANNFDDSNVYKCMIILKTMPMDASQNNNTKNVSIKNISFDNNGYADAGKDGIIQMRGCYDSIIENCNFTVNGANCWAIILFSANHNILVNNCVADNISADNSLGGCIWVRSGLQATTDDTKTKNVNITNCSLSSTAKDELFVIADGVDGGWTECQADNLTLNGNATTNLPNFLLVVNTVTTNGYVKATLNNIMINGKCGNYAIYGHAYSDIHKFDLTANNINITLEKGGGIQGGYNTDYYIYTNCNIKLSENKNGGMGIVLVNSFVNRTLEACFVKNCIVDTGDSGRVCCEQCASVENSTLKTTGKGFHSYGNYRGIIANNRIFANVNAIHCQNNSSNGAYDCIFMGNYMSRLTESDNSGSIAINVPYIKNSRSLANRYLLKTGSATGTSYGFNYYDSASSSSNYTKDDNYTNV